MSKYIMVIDDSPTIRVSVELALKQLGFIIKQAGNGQDGLDKIDELKRNGDEIVLCLTDINMPVLSGIEFIVEFRKIDKYTPVIVLTTESEKSIIQQGRNVGASGWIIKPFNVEDIINIVTRFLK